MCFFGSLPCSPSHGAYANAGINHYGNVSVNHYANVTVPTCQTGGKAAYKDLSFLLFFGPNFILNLPLSLYVFIHSLKFVVKMYILYPF